MSTDVSKLRPWQAAAMEKYRVMNKPNFTVTATPGAGKTTFALTIAEKLLEVGAIKQVIVVAPTDHLRTQWAESATELGIFLDPSLSNRVGTYSDDYTGYVLTYAQAASNPDLHRRRAMQKPTLVIFDEIHHAGDGLRWGDAILHAFGNTNRRLLLTGTPFRSSNTSKIPFIHYEETSEGVQMSMSDYAYGYGDALKDKVVRPVTFAAYSGEAAWVNSDGETLSTLLSDAESKDMQRQALRATLDFNGAWITHVLRAANAHLTELRESIPDAGGMVLAADQESAREYAKILRRITHQPVTVVVSDDNKADKKIDAYRRGDTPWLVAVRMVSEGVDIPRLCVGVWATNYQTPLFFAQAVGRFVRSRNPSESATVFLPAIKPLLALAATMEEQRQHAVTVATQEEEDEAKEREERQRSEPTLAQQNISADAEFDHVLFNGRALDGTVLSDEDASYVGLPGILSPQQIASLLRDRDLELRQSGNTEGRSPVESGGENLPRKIAEARKDINRLVSRIALTRNIGHAHAHKLAQKQVPGPPSASATLSILEQRRDWLQEQV